ncbi:MAG: hypothetical protein PHY54_11485 [Methylococcales bacterium]|nr:hypothetical protein [Methylococcales bacterium]
MNKSASPKLLKLKKWLTLPDAAKHLSAVCKNEISEADILHFAIDGDLKLSIRLFRNTTAISCRAVHYKKADLDIDIANGIFPDVFKRRDLPTAIIESISKSFVENMIEGIQPYELSDSYALECEKERIIIEKSMLDMAIDYLRTNDEDQYLVEESLTQLKEGVWDLSMLGTELLELQRRHYKLISGLNGDILKKELPTIGVCFNGADGQIFKLQATHCNTVCHDTLLAQLKMLKQQIYEIFYSYHNDSMLQNIYYEVAEKRMKIWHKHIAIDRFQGNDFCTINQFPEDSYLVVRIESLMEFERLIENDELEINTTIKSDKKSQSLEKLSGHVERHAKNREQALGAAFAVLSKWPEECRDKNGNVIASKVAKLIETKANYFWDYSEKRLEPDTTAGHLRDWISKSNSKK